jgi:asparagine synthase (glutamine-hydrolysing)
MVRSGAWLRDGLLAETDRSQDREPAWVQPFAAVVRDSPFPPRGLEHQQFIDLKTFLADDILFKTDRASMAASLEARVPYLDHELVEFAFRIPARFKLRGLVGKWVLRRAFKGRLPETVLHRRKSGFSVPIASWLRGELRPLMNDLLTESRLRNQGLFDPATVQRLLREHASVTADHGRSLWALLMFQIWFDRFARAEGPAAGGRVRASAELALGGATR